MKLSNSSLSEKTFPYVLLLPALLIGSFVLAYPLLNGVFLSVTDYSLLDPTSEFVGFKNFMSLFGSSVYWEIFANTLIIVGSSVFIQLVIGMIVALLMNRPFPGRAALRGGVLVIWVIPQIVVALIWLIILNSEFGILNGLLARIGLIDRPIYWLGRPIPAKLSLIMIYSWRGIPFFMVMLLAALQTVPKDIIDSSKIDGVTASQGFWHITLPFIKDIVLLSCILSTVRLFQDITQIFVLTSGGPKYSTTTLALHVYKTAFDSFETARAAAVGVTWLVLLLFLAFFYVRLVTRKGFR